MRWRDGRTPSSAIPGSTTRRGGSTHSRNTSLPAGTKQSLESTSVSGPTDRTPQSEAQRGPTCMRLIGYVHNGIRHIGSVDGEKVAPRGPAADFYRDPAAALAAEPVGPTLALADLEQAPAVPETAKVFILGINYLSHADESKQIGRAHV